MNGWQAGWRELSELNLRSEDLPSLESEVERDSQGKIRIRYESRMESVQQAKDILGYRNTVKDEERRLTPAIRSLVYPMLEQIGQGLFSGAVVFAGLTEMIDATASSLETARNLLENDPSNLVDAPSGGATSILEALAVPFDVSALSTLGLEDLMPRDRRPDLIASAKVVASELGLNRVAEQLGVMAVKAVSAAWAVNRRLTFAGVATDEGARYLSEVFWKRMGMRRADVDSAWRGVMVPEFEAQSEKEQLGSEKEQLGMLLWSWPEVL
jgi:hypothetical protein